MPEIENVPDVGTAERVYRLRIVTYDADVVLWFGKLFDEQELDIVRVLVLIHQDILKLLLIAFAHLGTDVQQAEHVDQQVIKVHCIGCFQPRLVQRIDSRQIVHPHLAVLT